MILRRPMFVLGTTILLMQAVFMPIGMVYTETTTNTEAQEQVELPPMNSYLEEQESEARFNFTESQIQGTVEEPMKATFFSDQEVSEVRVTLPEEAQVLTEQLPVGISVKQDKSSKEWVIQAQRAQNTFVLPLVFDTPGIYEMSVEEASVKFEICEQEENLVGNPSEETEFPDEDLSEGHQEQQMNEEDQLVSNKIDKKVFERNGLNTIVTADNFLDYFGFSGTASVNDNIITLTEEKDFQSGSMYLKSKIDSTYPFILTGKVFLGSNSNSADGIGFGFHVDAPDSIGLEGSGFGLAGLTDIFGFKLDTYYNGTNYSPFRPDPINTGAFGSFVYMDNGWFTSYTGDDAPARSVSRPSGLWRDISIMLSEHSILRIEYEDMVWEKEIPPNLEDRNLSFLVSASTGSVHALQQFQFESFHYSRERASVVVNYIDNSGNKLSEPTVIDGLVGDEYQTDPKIIPGFTLEEMPENALGFFKEEEQIVNYIYIKDVITPVDPMNPEVEVNPENKPDLPEDQGQLSIDFISSFNFGSQTISVKDKTYSAQPQRLLNEDGTVSDEVRPNYVQVSDRRSENERGGWQLAVTQREQFTAEGKELTGARLRLTNQELVTAQGGNPPSLQATNPLTLVPGNKRTLIRAEDDEGTGTWIYRFGDQESADKSVHLDIPAMTNPDATGYSTTLVWELSSVPEN